MSRFLWFTVYIVLCSPGSVLRCCRSNGSENEILLDAVHVHHRQRLIGQQTAVGVASFPSPLPFGLRGLYVVVVQD